MSGIYIHIPYCRKACSYCDFHFSTNFSTHVAMLQALQLEIRLQRAALGRGVIRTIYVGGGTPSVWSLAALSQLFSSLHMAYDLSSVVEITLEANPEDITPKKLQGWLQLGINRLSIGIQSFNTAHLQLLGRSSSRLTGLQACEAAAAAGFKKISIDLIYGITSNAERRWADDIRLALRCGATHLSAYSLSIEPRTALAHAVATGSYHPPMPDEVADQLQQLCRETAAAGFMQYEVSSFARLHAQALHNRNYWQGKKYLGIGPGAHSYNGYKRWYNVSNNMTYIRALQKHTLPPHKVERLTPYMRWQELLLTGLRTQTGFSLHKAKKLLTKKGYACFLARTHQFSQAGFTQLSVHRLRPTQRGMHVADELIGKLSTCIDIS